ELQTFRKAAGEPITVGCTQESPLFAETMPESDIRFVNLRETAGWSKDAAAAGPKMAALIAAAGEPPPETAYVTLESEGVILIYRRDARGLHDAAPVHDTVQ